MKDAQAAIMAANGSSRDWAYIETTRGNKFFFHAPFFDIEDIANSLGNTCRFTGHCRQFYSVAEHCLLVASLVEHLSLGNPFEGLMHDAHEAYCGDLSAPAKSILPEFKAKLEHPLEVQLRVHYGFQPTISPGVKFADWVALMIEARQLMPSKGKDWNCVPEGVRECASGLQALRLNCWDPGVARDHFRAAFNELSVIAPP